jgi:hypothetical protein
MGDPFPHCNSQIDSGMDLGGHSDGLGKLSGTRGYDLDQNRDFDRGSILRHVQRKSWFALRLWYASTLTLKHRFVPLCEGGWILNASP